MTSDVRNCIFILLLTVIVGGVGFFGFHESGSFGLFGDAAHIIGDGLPFVGILFLALNCLLEEQEGMVEEFIKWTNRLFLAGSGLYIFVMGVSHLYHPEPIKPTVVAFATFELAGNCAQVYFAHKLRHLTHDDATHHGLMVHLFYDIGVSSIVLVSAIVIALKGWYWVDAVLSILLGLATPLVIRHIEQHSSTRHGHHCHTHGHNHTH
jgi:Co/Zn/Cd efflux system component